MQRNFLLILLFIFKTNVCKKWWYDFFALMLQINGVFVYIQLTLFGVKMYFFKSFNNNLNIVSHRNYDMSLPMISITSNIQEKTIPKIAVRLTFIFCDVVAWRFGYNLLVWQYILLWLSGVHYFYSIYYYSIYKSCNGFLLKMLI